MSGELEAAGALATAGLAAGAIEGREARGAGEGACLNCGVALSGPYCAQCGQAARAHRTLSHLLQEVLHGLFHFDTKAWRTLPMLAFRPGTLTRNYVYGKRARYVSPLALFLLTIFLMFFTFAFVDVPIGPDLAPQARENAAAELAQARAAVAEAERELAAAEAAPEDPHTGDLETRLARRALQLAQADVTRRELALARTAQALAAERESARQPAVESGGDANEEVVNGDGQGRWQDELAEAARNGDITIGSGFPQLDARILRSLENPDLALYKIQDAASKFSFLLVPISLPFMWLLFIWRRGLTLYDHVVFTLNSLSFASVAFVIVALTAGIQWLGWLGGALFGLGMPAHMYFHLKGAYALGWWSAIWRTSFLLLFALVSLSIFVLAVVLLGLGG